MWKLRKYTCVAAVMELEVQWRALHEASVRPDISLSPDWIIPWYSASEASITPHVLGIFKADTLVVVAPMHTAVQSFRIAKLSALQSSANGYSPSGGVVVSAQASQNDQFKAMQLLSEESNFELFRVYKMPQYEAMSLCSIASESRQFRSGMEAVMSTPMIKLTGDWEEYLATRSRSHRKSMRRKVKRIEKQAKVELVVSVLKSREDPFFAEIVRISERSWKKKEGADLRNDVFARNFLRELLERQASKGNIKIWLLKVDGLAIAYELHVESGGTIYPIRADYDMAFSDLSPGQVLLQMVLKSLFEDQSALCYDSCADEYEYLKSWAHYTTHYYSVDMFSTGLKPSLVYLVKYHLLPAYRRIKQRIGFTAT